MIVYRLVEPDHEKAALSGIGSELYGGRWNSVGRPMVYTASSASLVQLELLAHFSPLTALSLDRRLAIELPDELSIDELKLESLPPTWANYPAPPALARFGDTWLENASAPVLKVPSAVEPLESNYLLNPAHPDIAAIRIASAVDFSFDPRLVNPDR